MTNPNPVAPKTDTPATQDRRVLIVDTGSEALRFLVCRVRELESTLAAERASRLQAEDALQEIADFKGRTLIGHSREDGASYSAGANAAFERCAGIALDALSKPSVSPEQEKP